MKKKLYLVWEEAASGTSLALGIVLNIILAVAAFKLSRSFCINKGITEQASNAIALVVSIILILLASILLNIFFGTKRKVVDSEPSSEELMRILKGYELDPKKEIKSILEGPKDISIIAKESGILNQLQHLADIEKSENENAEVCK